MGFLFSKIFSGLVGSEQMRIIIIGLDNAGKTTILCKSEPPPLISQLTRTPPYRQATPWRSCPDRAK